MKKIIMFILVMLIAVAGFAQVHFVPNPDGTLNYSWDAPVNVLDGTVPASQITYEFYIALRTTASSDREQVSNFELVGTVGPFTIGGVPGINNVDHTILGEGEIVAGVRAVRDVPDVPDGTFYTGMLWSDLGGVPDPFTIWYFIPLDLPTNLRVE